MKTIMIATTLVALSVTFDAPVQAASTAPLEQMLGGSFDRNGRRCDTPRDIAQHPRCTKARASGRSIVTAGPSGPP